MRGRGFAHPAPTAGSGDRLGNSAANLSLVELALGQATAASANAPGHG